MRVFDEVLSPALLAVHPLLRIDEATLAATLDGGD